MTHDARTRAAAKQMTKEEFERLLRRKWSPVSLDKGTGPAFLANLPEDKVVALFGSASLAEPNPNADGNAAHGVVGGIDVYRSAEVKDGVALNKDWYAIYQDPDDPDKSFVIGPQRDPEHWIDAIPPRLAFAEPASVDKAIQYGSDDREPA